MFSFQARAARAILKLGVRDVAAEVGVAPNTISRFEAGHTDAKEWRPHPVTENALKSFYESKGLQFTEYGVDLPVPNLASDKFIIELEIAIQRKQYTEWITLVNKLMDMGWTNGDAALEAMKRLRRRAAGVPVDHLDDTPPKN